MATARCRGVLALVLPVVVLQLAAVGSLLLGRDTLFLRDVLAVHLPMKQEQATAMREGSLPELDVRRGGGQPLLGNPNATPFYPDGLLYLVAPPLWALNAHFWLHFLLAPWTLSWLARRLGCGWPAAWAGGTVYALSGFFLSQMSLYNLVAGMALAPAFVAACLAARDGAAASGARRGAAAAGALWALLLLAGEPAVAAMALGVAALALMTTRPPARPEPPEHAAEAGERVGREAAAGFGRGVAPLLLALACGTAVAAPQLVELLRILPTSLRGVRGYDLANRTIASWNPVQIVEQLLPLAFGRLDRTGPGGFWGQRFHTGTLPLFATLYPGILPLALLAAAGRGRGRGGGFAWATLGLGVLLALGRYNPLLTLLADFPGSGLLRFPVKAWLLVALGLSLLAAAGWERALVLAEAGAARRLRVALLGLAAVLLLGSLLAALLAEPLQAWMVQVRPRSGLPALVAGEARRWVLVAAALAGLAALLLALLRRSRGALAGAAALGLHAAAQLVLLAPATLSRDDAAPYLRRPVFAARLPAETRLVHGSINRLFGNPPRRRPRDGEGRWLARQGAVSGYPVTGVPELWRYELANSPEGLDSFLTRAAIEAIKPLDDARRVRLLRVWGVEAVVIERPLAAGIGEARLVETVQGPLAPVFLYRLEGSTPAVRRVSGARRAADPRRALATLVDPAFDPRTGVVLQGDGPPTPPGTGTVDVEREAAEELVVRSRGARPGWVVVQRAWQPLWRATVDGRAAKVVAADVHRLAVAMPAGEHRLRLWVERAPLRRAAWATAMGLVGLLALARLGARRTAAAPAALPAA